MKIKRWIGMLLCMLLCVGMLPTMVFAAGTISVSKSVKGAESWDMVFTVNGETRSPFTVSVGETVHAEITVKPSEGNDLAYVIVGNSYTPTQGSANDLSETAGLTKIFCEGSQACGYKMEYEFTVPEGVTMLCVRVVCDVSPKPVPEPEIKISTKASDSVAYDSGAVEFLGVVSDKKTGNEITEGEVQYYLNGSELFSAVRYDSSKTEKGFYRSVSTDQVFDETALQMGENTIYAVYRDDEGHTATSNTIKIYVVKKDICKEQSPISTAYSTGAVYDGTPGYGRAQFSVMANDDYWQKRDVSIENLSFSAEKDGVEYELTSSDYEYKGNTQIVFAAPYPGTYTFTAHVNHKYYTGEKSVTVTVGKRDIVISPKDMFTNRNTEPAFEAEINGMGLAGSDELKNVQYKIEDGADLGVPGEYSVEIASYELDNEECYNVTLESGTLTVLEDADYTKVDEAIAKADALNPDDYTNFSVVETAVNAVVRGKNITEQDEVDAMALAIENAIANLEMKPAGETPSDTATPTVDKGGSAVNDDVKSPQTGNDINIVLWLAIMLAAGAALTGTAVYGRKRKYSK